MRSLYYLMVGAISMFGVASASAEPITIDPNNFAVGTNISFASPGVALFRVTNQYDSLLGIPSLAVAPVFSASYSDGAGLGSYHDPRDVSGCVAQILQTAANSINYCHDASGTDALLLVFDAAADFVEWEAGWNIDAPEAIAFDAAFHQIGRVIGYGAPLPTQGTVFSRQSMMSISGSDMKYVFIGADAGQASVNRLQYNAVPEPSTLILSGIGFVGALYRFRRRR